MGTIRFQSTQPANILCLDAQHLSRSVAYRLWEQGRAFKDVNDDSIIVTKSTVNNYRQDNSTVVYILCNKGVIDAT